jgi:hypothetical protein
MRGYLTNLVVIPDNCQHLVRLSTAGLAGLARMYEEGIAEGLPVFPKVAREECLL